MSVVRRFLVAPSLARLIRKERGASRISEGYFAPQSGRTSFVRIDGQKCHLILVSAGAGEEHTEVPRAHGDALMEVCAGKAVYDRTILPLGSGREASIDKFTIPSGLDLVSVGFADEGASQGFYPPIWFGREVTSEEGYDSQSIGLQGAPKSGEVGLSNAALDAVLDLVEPRFGYGRSSGQGSSFLTQNRGDATQPARAAEPAAQAAPAAAPAPAAEAKAEEAAEEPEPAAEPIVDEAPVETPEAAPDDESPQSEEKVDEQPAKAEASAEATEASAEKAEPSPEKPEPGKGDARIDDVIESLSQALGAAIQKPPSPEKQDPLAAQFERWTVRPRRTQQ